MSTPEVVIPLVQFFRIVWQPVKELNMVRCVVLVGVLTCALLQRMLHRLD